MSKSPLLAKFILIGAIVALAIVFSVPPEERINLGLDLQGGAHILMQVQTDTAIEFKLELTQSRIGNALETKDISYDSIVLTGRGNLEVRGADPGRNDDVRDILRAVEYGWTVSNLGGGDWRVTMPPDERAEFARTAVKQTEDRIRERINALGVVEPFIQKQGADRDRILVQLPGVEDPERIESIIVEPAKLEWKEVSFPPTIPDGARAAYRPPTTRDRLLAEFGGVLPADTEVIPQTFADGTTIYWPLKQVSAVSGPDLRSARRESGGWNEQFVSFELTQDAGRRFRDVTSRNVGLQMAIVLDDQVISAPVIQEAIGAEGRITGRFTVEEAKDLALKLESGAFPTRVEIIEKRTVGPSLGADSIRRGLWAGLAGFAGVLVFMVAYYRMSGINAVVALALNVVLVFGALGALPFLFAGANLRATLTLPGIAGLILTVGMAVDANVLIFERIREELRLGKTVRAAVDQGFGKAFMTILDCNITTVVAAIFLAMPAHTGPVRGFAVTLVIGLAASMFTAVFVSRQLFELVLSRTGRVESLSI